MRVSLVTITYNSESVIRGFLESYNAISYKDLELIVVDNASTDETLSIIDDFNANHQITSIKNKQNKGVASGNNQGIRLALENKSDWVLLINNDVEFEPMLIDKLLGAHDQYHDSIIVPKMLFYDHPNDIWYAGGFFSKGYINKHRGLGQPNSTCFMDDIVEYAPTCCALIHRKVFDDVGLMDEKYFVYFDDSDFFFRVLKDGRHKVRLINDVEFYHKIGSLTNSRTGDRKKFVHGPFFVKQMTRNYVYFLKKIGTLKSWFYVFYFFVRVNLRFIFSGKYKRNMETFWLIQVSYFKGLFM